MRKNGLVLKDLEFLEAVYKQTGHVHLTRQLYIPWNIHKVFRLFVVKCWLFYICLSDISVLYRSCPFFCKLPPIARFMGPTWSPSRAERTQVGPMLAPKTLLSETPPHYQTLCRPTWRHWTTKMLVRYRLLSVCLRFSQFSQSSFI